MSTGGARNEWAEKIVSKVPGVSEDGKFELLKGGWYSYSLGNK